MSELCQAPEWLRILLGFAISCVIAIALYAVLELRRYRG